MAARSGRLAPRLLEQAHMNPEVGIGATAGTILGGITAASAYVSYPAGPHAWSLPLVGAGSLVAVGGLYAASARVGRLRIGDYLVLAYAGVLLAALAFAMTGEAVRLLRDAVPGGMV